MADKKNKSVKKGKGKGRGSNNSKPKPVKVIMAQPQGDKRVSNHVNMLLDPCNSALAPTAYRGADGILARFKNVVNIAVSATNNNHIFVFYPGYNGVWSQPIGDPNASLAPSYTTPGPGQGFLLNTAQSQRAVAACAEFKYTGTELARQGTVYRGVVPASALAGSSINTLLPLLQASERMPDLATETKWIPSAVEEEYWQTGSAAPDGTGDRNVLVIIMIGNADLTAQIVTTLVCEWRPKYGMGMQTPSPNTPDTPAGLEKVRTAVSKAGNWWVEASHTAAHVTGVAKRVYNATRSMGNIARVAGAIAL